MIQFYKKDKYLILKYSYDSDDNNWVKAGLKDKGYITINRVFRFTQSEIFSSEELSETEAFEFGFKYEFVIGNMEGEYYKLNHGVFNLQNDFFFHKLTKFKVSYFKTQTNATILPKLDKLISEPIYIGGQEQGDGKISIELYESILKYLPNSHEIKLYSDSRIEGVLSDFLSTGDKALKKYNNYLSRKLDYNLEGDLSKIFDEYEIDKLSNILERLEGMLSNEVSYSEKRWQDEILKILLFLFPKYVAVFKEVAFKDTNKKTKRLDYVLVDYLGHIDIVEIKKPMDASLISKSVYRGNHVPKHALSGSIMQIEKYIFHLNKLGKQGEKQLTKKYSKQLPANMKIKITNPNGLIVMGRERGLTSTQLDDLEIIKRKYKNVLDIITYDDLIKRIKVGIEQMKKI